MVSKDNISRLNKNDLRKILDKKYPEILQAMNEENYEITYPKHLLFNEILYEGKVVGFFTLELLEFYSREVALNECYILPEYRRKDLFARELINLIETPNLTLFFRRPTKSIIKILLDNNLAILTENNIAISFIPFMVETKDIFKSKKIKKHVKSIFVNKNEIFFSLIYDFNVGSVVFKNVSYYYPFNNDDVLISKPRLIDDNEDIDKIRPKYLKDLANHIYSNNHLIQELKNEVYSRIRDDLSVKNLIGTEDQLNPEFVDLLEENTMTLDDGFKIHEEIIDALDCHEIRHKGIQTRINYLMGYDTVEKLDNIDLKCPFCENCVPFYLKTCNACGHDLISENTFKSVKNQILEYTNDIGIINSHGDSIDEGSNMYLRLIDWANEKGYDLDEVFYTQSEYSCFCILQSVGKPNDYCIGMGFDSYLQIREGSGMIFAINHDYIENLTYERYLDDLKNKYTISDLELELDSHGISYYGNDRENLIEQIRNSDFFEYVLDERFVLTKKGEEFIKNPILEYFDLHLSDDYYFYEFKKIFLKYKDDLTLDEMAEKLKNEV